MRNLHRALGLSPAALCLLAVFSVLASAQRASTGAALRIVPGKSIGGVSLGDSRPDVRRQLGIPEARARFCGALGNAIERWTDPDLTLDFADIPGGWTTILLVTTNRAARTAARVGVGTSRSTLAARVHGLSCVSASAPTYCQLGDPNRAGSHVTTFLLWRGKVRRVSISLAVNT